jgi:NAD(P) transhydrogenase subunit alpha
MPRKPTSLAVLLVLMAAGTIVWPAFAFQNTTGESPSDVAAQPGVVAEPETAAESTVPAPSPATTHSGHAAPPLDFASMAFVLMLATFIGIGVIRRVSRLLHTPLMSLTNAISAISVVGAIIVAGGESSPTIIRLLGAIALFASMTNIISGFLITDRMLKMFKTRPEAKA